MRRIYAILLLFVLSSGLVTPLLSFETEAKLPACCKRDGKHGCAMSKKRSSDSKTASASGVGLKSVRTNCPLYPADSIASSNQAFGSAVSAHQLNLIRCSTNLNGTYVTSVLSISCRREAPKRGPPSLFA